MGKKKTPRERVEYYLITYKKILSIRPMEIYLSLPKGTIQNFVKHHRKIQDDRIKIIDSFLLDISYEYIRETEGN
ncbi:hypothetical protein HN014_22190 (plasmid) [Aquimarina sp. TRL1]|uniref:hypothetical protein n=1 Tax=Aquimarina sp. (strain TRL1) TaxID=2736252 RepID=UPI00158BE4D4|nr:hypothetical protein [Aquimarina sp. TRL1]QKX07712.1 hypothetical protein HN014_22190 [Aquimarina sp. TRL1]